MGDWINEKTLADLRAFGWHVLGIPGDGTTPSLAHTIGLVESFDHPEIVMVGLSMPILAQLVGELGERVAKRGARFAIGGALDDLLEGHQVRFGGVEVVAHERFLPGAHEHYGERRWGALQCLWPDKAGRFPGERDFSGECATREPALGDATWAPIYAAWVFEESYVLGCITTRHVIDRSKPILLVTHDDDDGGWQFLCGTTRGSEDGRIIALSAAVRLDPSLAELADLPLGWQAERRSPGSAWVRSPSKDDDDENGSEGGQG